MYQLRCTVPMFGDHVEVKVEAMILGHLVDLARKMFSDPTIDVRRNMAEDLEDFNKPLKVQGCSEAVGVFTWRPSTAEEDRDYDERFWKLWEQRRDEDPRL